ncbi:extracellular solute-binding protein, partial [Salinispora arenicola]|nr:extracellular solute-binding protein [Salinispora arenicola]
MVIKDLLPAVRNYYSTGGELTSIPTVVTTNILFGNKGMLERAGVERMPATWQELTAACAPSPSCQSAPRTASAGPSTAGCSTWRSPARGGLFSNNGNGRTGRSTRLFIDSPEMLNYVRWWQGMHDSGYYHYTGEPRDYFAAHGGVRASGSRICCHII